MKVIDERVSSTNAALLDFNDLRSGSLVQNIETGRIYFVVVVDGRRSLVVLAGDGVTEATAGSGTSHGIGIDLNRYIELEGELRITGNEPL